MGRPLRILALGLLLAACGGGGGGGSGGTGGSGGGGGATVASVLLVPGRDVVLGVGASRPLAAYALASNGAIVSGSAIVWTSSDPAVASVDTASGLLTTHAPGTAVITATARGRSDSFTVESVTAVTPRVDAGHDHTCSLSRAGVGYCTGRNGDGQLSVSTAPFDYSMRSLEVAGGRRFTDLQVGRIFTCGLTAAGEVWCWGGNAQGQLGNASFTGSQAPVKVAGGLTFTALSVGADHSCGLIADGTAYCWGKESDADGKVNVNTPVQVNTALRFSAISAGEGFTCALTSTGLAYCWGKGAYNYLPNTVDKTRPGLPFAVQQGALRFKSISAGGSYYACALTEAGAAYCWSNTDAAGQLGNGAGDTPSLAPVAVAGGLAFRQVSVGMAHACALTTSDEAWCWGYNAPVTLSTPGGRLGDGTTTNRPQPTAVSGGHRFQYISAGREYTCALTTAGDTRCWGWNYARFGDGVTDSTLVPSTPGLPRVVVTAEASTGVVPGSPTVTTTATLQAGTSLPVTLNIGYVPGSFTQDGPREPTSPVELQAPPESQYRVLQTVNPSRVPFGGKTQVTLTVPATTPASFYYVGTSGQGTASEVLGGGLTLQVTTTAAAGSGGSGGSGGTGTYTCPSATGLGTGYHCMQNSAGQWVPGKYNIPAMHGTWVDEVAGICITWRSDGQAQGIYKGGGLTGSGPTETEWGDWGVIVRSNGVPEGTATQWYVFTEELDAQTALLGYDSAANQIIGWDFVKKSCPW